MAPSSRELERLAAGIRKRLLTMIYKGSGGHTGGSLSSADILVALYFHVMNIRPDDPAWPDRDRFVLSKGHSVEGYYAVLSKRGFFDDSVLDSYGTFNSPLAGHPVNKVPGIEVNSGALGHGLSVGTGMALAGKRDNKSYRVYVLMGDGEHGEGSLMEAAAAAGHYKLDNLTGIIDRNKLQISGYTEEILRIDDLRMKYEACGWAVRECDGHSMEELTAILKQGPFEKGRPSFIIAHTTKGKGVSFIENDAAWHHRVPSEEQYKLAMAELNRKLEELNHD
ncbi:MAG: transketolase [Bacteroidales bacterium]|nr:transketolase [Bacteroidales bacterium]